MLFIDWCVGHYPLGWCLPCLPALPCPAPHPTLPLVGAGEHCLPACPPAPLPIPTAQCQTHPTCPQAVVLFCLPPSLLPCLPTTPPPLLPHLQTTVTPQTVMQALPWETCVVTDCWCCYYGTGPVPPLPPPIVDLTFALTVVTVVTVTVTVA